MLCKHQKYFISNKIEGNTNNTTLKWVKYAKIRDRIFRLEIEPKLGCRKRAIDTVVKRSRRDRDLERKGKEEKEEGLMNGG